MGFPTSHQRRSCVTHIFRKMGFRYPNLSFFAEIWAKTIQSCYRVSLSKNFQRQSCSAINYLLNGINIQHFGRGWACFHRHKRTAPIRKDARFTFHTRRTVHLYRTCWVCFASEEDDRDALWVRPCRCRGTNRWVHQMCLQRWVDEKQRGNSTAKVLCPQCNTEYLIIFPKLGELCIWHSTTAWLASCNHCINWQIMLWYCSFFLLVR